ncbi:MAG: DUF5103 domain-containing protein [Bacteroidales bacterium]|nr:DUF5103 domain-containing protein [Bacteroidales bacterium]
MSKTIAIIFLFIAGILSHSLQAQAYRTEVFSTRIQTLRVSVADKWELPPIIDLYAGDPVEISFDVLGASPEYLTYKILHCNADWTLSPLIEPEYMNGLQNNPLDDYNNSFNTRMDYVHYKLLVPNDNINLLVSGNYVVQVFSEVSELPILTACFSVVEPEANIEMKVSSVTDKGANTKYQGVSFEINYGNQIQSPAQDLKVYVQQNNRSDNEAKLIKPLSIQNRKAVYDHNPALIFEAGNEYRSFEMITTLNTGLNIEAVEFHSPYYHSILTPDFLRSNRSYSFYEDINGKVFIRNQDAYDSNLEADYQFVHFYIPSEKPLIDHVYILSEAFHNILDARSQMEYSPIDKGYVKTVLLKEGYYNYLYVTRRNDNSPASTSLTEGDFYQTENEYRVMVYSRTVGTRYDKLIGVETLQFK